MEEELEEQEEAIQIKKFQICSILQKISRLLIISITNLDLMVFFQETINLE